VKKIFFAILFITAVFPVTVLSQWYVGTTGGQWELDEDGWDNAAIFSGRGGYKFNDYLSIEGSYVHFAESEFENDYAYATLRGGLWDAGLVGTIPLSDRFELFGKIGYGFWAADVNDYGFNSDDTGDSWNYGGGFQINFSKNWSMLAGYQRYEFDVDFGDLKADTIYAGVKFYFDFSKPDSSRAVSSSVSDSSYPTNSVASPQLKAVSDAERENCQKIKSVTTGSGGPGDLATHNEIAMKKAVDSAAIAGADSYYVVDIQSNDSNVSVIMEALRCN
jgi:opacity protein-like surface antigen